MITHCWSLKHGLKMECNSERYDEVKYRTIKNVILNVLRKKKSLSK